MRARNHNGALAANESFFQQLRQRTITQLEFQHRLGFGIATADGVADHHQFRRVTKIFFAIILLHLNTALGQKRGHRRIHIRIRAGDAYAAFF